MMSMLFQLTTLSRQALSMISLTVPMIPSSTTYIPTHLTLYFQLNPYGASVNVSIYVQGNHHTLGMVITVNSDNNHIILSHMLPSTLAHIILQWKTTLPNSTVVGIDGHTMNTIKDVKVYIVSM